MSHQSMTPRPRRWRSALPSRLALATLLLSQTIAASAAEPPEAVAIVSGLTGEVAVRADTGAAVDPQLFDRSDEVPPVRPGTKIVAGDVVLTRHGVVQIRFVTRVESSTEIGRALRECRLDNRTQVRLSSWQWLRHVRTPEEDLRAPGAPLAILELWDGSVHCLTLDKEPLGMRWNAGSASVLIKGTDVEMTYSRARDELTVRVRDGKVVVFGPQGSRTVETGQTVRFVHGVAPQAPPA